MKVVLPESMCAEIPIFLRRAELARSFSGSFLLISSITSFSSSYVLGIVFSSFWGEKVVENGRERASTLFKVLAIPTLRLSATRAVRGKLWRNMAVEVGIGGSDE